MVLDASATVEYLLVSSAGRDVARAIRSPGETLHVPALCDIEVAAALRRLLLRRAVTEERAGSALLDYLDLPLRRHGHRAQLARILALRANLSAYDAAYVALAEHLGATLLTADQRLGRALSRSRLAHVVV